MKKQVIQKHHISYNPEIIVAVYKGEHGILTRLKWTKRPPSKAFVDELKKWLYENEKRAIDLGDLNDEVS